MKNVDTLKHITDVGASHGDGIDSNLRIEEQYNALGVENPKIISAGNSPLHIAFVACTKLLPQANLNAEKVLRLLGQAKPSLLPKALNCAPRNSSQSQRNGQEDYIYRVRSEEEETLLIYGLEVLRWVLEFRGRVKTVVEKIISVPEIIPDTSNGSQFRSGEHLPIVHFLEALGILDEYSEREIVALDEIIRAFPDKDRENGAVVAPSDEYKNGRLILDKKLWEQISLRDEIQIPEITNQILVVKNSLTEVVQGELSVWPSSNHFSDENLKVINIATRWAENTTQTTDNKVIELSSILSGIVGKICKVEM